MVTAAATLALLLHQADLVEVVHKTARKVSRVLGPLVKVLQERLGLITVEASGPAVVGVVLERLGQLETLVLVVQAGLVYQIPFLAVLFFMLEVVAVVVGMLPQGREGMVVEAQDLRLLQHPECLAALIRAEVVVLVLDQEVELAERVDRAL